MAEDNKEKPVTDINELRRLYIQESGINPGIEWALPDRDQKFNTWLQSYNKRIREEESKSIEPQLRAMRGMLFQRQLDRTGGVRSGMARAPYEGPDSAAGRRETLAQSGPKYTPLRTEPVQYAGGSGGVNGRNLDEIGKDPLNIKPDWWEGEKRKLPFYSILDMDPVRKELKKYGFKF